MRPNGFRDTVLGVATALAIGGIGGAVKMYRDLAVLDAQRNLEANRLIKLEQASVDCDRNAIRFQAFEREHEKQEQEFTALKHRVELNGLLIEKIAKKLGVQ